jgi:hypothetical protein
MRLGHVFTIIQWDLIQIAGGNTHDASQFVLQVTWRHQATCRAEAAGTEITAASRTEQTEQLEPAAETVIEWSSMSLHGSW